MNKKKVTSWGVSFASIALVAGMMSYLGITNKDTTNKTNTVAQSQVSTQSSTQQSQINYEIPNQTTDSSGSQQSTSTDQTFASQHGSFDTTTGGT